MLESRLFIFGGYAENHVLTDTTQVLDIGQKLLPTKLGQESPEKMAYHCAAKINESLIMLTGGQVSHVAFFKIDCEQFMFAERKRFSTMSMMTPLKLHQICQRVRIFSKSMSIS